MGPVAALALVGVFVALLVNLRLREANDDAERALRQAERFRYYDSIARAHARWRYGNMHGVERLLDDCPPHLRNWEWYYLKQLCHADLLTLTDAGECVAFSPDGTRLAAAGQHDVVKVWQVPTGQELLTLRGHSGLVYAVTFRPDGEQLASGGSDDTVRLWDARTGRLLRTLRGHGNSVMGLSYSPDGARLASSSADGTIRFWGPATGSEGGGLEGHTGYARSIAFSPDGKRLASAGTDHTVKIWDAETGRELLSLRGHTDRIYDVAFSPDGSLLASVSLDKTLRLWDARPLTAEVREAREAVRLLDALFARPLRRADVLAWLRDSPTLRPRLREKAIELAARYREETDPANYRRACWAILRQPHLNSLQYLLAYCQAQAACQLDPKTGASWTAPGLADYRLGRFPEALAALRRADEMKPDDPTTLAALGMTQHQQGRAEQARIALRRLRELSRTASQPYPEALSTFLQEAETLIEGTPGRLNRQ